MATHDMYPATKHGVTKRDTEPMERDVGTTQRSMNPAYNDAARNKRWWGGWGGYGLGLGYGGYGLGYGYPFGYGFYGKRDAEHDHTMNKRDTTVTDRSTDDMEDKRMAMHRETMGTRDMASMKRDEMMMRDTTGTDTVRNKRWWGGWGGYGLGYGGFGGYGLGYGYPFGYGFYGKRDATEHSDYPTRVIKRDAEEPIDNPNDKTMPTEDQATTDPVETRDRRWVAAGGNRGWVAAGGGYRGGYRYGR